VFDDNVFDTENQKPLNRKKEDSALKAKNGCGIKSNNVRKEGIITINEVH
jgi:hypothetical protein